MNSYFYHYYLANDLYQRERARNQSQVAHAHARRHPERGRGASLDSKVKDFQDGGKQTQEH